MPGHPLDVVRNGELTAAIREGVGEKKGVRRGVLTTAVQDFGLEEMNAKLGNRVVRAGAVVDMEFRESSRSEFYAEKSRLASFIYDISSFIIALRTFIA